MGRARRQAGAVGRLRGRHKGLLRRISAVGRTHSILALLTGHKIGRRLKWRGRKERRLVEWPALRHKRAHRIARLVRNKGRLVFQMLLHALLLGRRRSSAGRRLSATGGAASLKGLLRGRASYRRSAHGPAGGGRIIDRFAEKRNVEKPGRPEKGQSRAHVGPGPDSFDIVDGVVG